MTTLKPNENTTGPRANLIHFYAKHVDTALKATEPMLRAAGLVQFEVARLAVQHGRTLASFPAELSRCRTPVDILFAQARFWQAIGLTQAQGLHRIWQSSTALALGRAMTVTPRNTPRDILEVRSEADADQPVARNRQAA